MSSAYGILERDVTTPSLDIHLDPEHGRKLAALSEARGSTSEAVIVDLIDRAYAEQDQARRLALVDEIGRLEIEDPPDPKTMSAQLAEAHGRLDLP